MHRGMLLLAFFAGIALLSGARGECGKCSEDIQTFGANDVEGVIKSPGYPDDEYCDNQDCTWVIKAGKSGTGLHLTLDELATESGPDWLLMQYTVEGKTRNLTRWTGNVDADSVGTLTFPEDVAIELKFHTDVSYKMKGFQLRFNRFNITDDDCACGPLVNTAMRRTKRRIKSPNFPDPYCHNLRCFYAIIADPGESVQIRFDVFETESRFDHIRMYDGLSIDPSKVLARLNGSLTPKRASERTYSSLSDAMLLEFRSDGDQAHRGFSARYKAVDGRCACREEVLTESSDTFHSTGFEEGFYCPGTACNYTIRVQEGRRVQLDVPYLHLKGFKDSLTISRANGLRYDFATLRGRREDFRFTADDNEVVLRFKSAVPDSAIASATRSAPSDKLGFNATYRTIDRDEDCRCQGRTNPLNLTALQGTIEGRACGPLDCYYRLPRPATNESMLVLEPKVLRLDGGNVDIRLFQEGAAGTINEFRHFHSGYADTQTVNQPVTSDFPVVLHFRAKNRSSANFELSYQWHLQTCKCERVSVYNITEEEQVITSPGYPSPYCDNMHCEYRLVASLGQKVVVSVKEFETETPDPLSFFEGQHESANQLIASINGTRVAEQGSGLPRLVESRRHQMLLRFKTDGSIVYRGWNLTVHAEAADEPETTTFAPQGGGGGGVAYSPAPVQVVTPEWFNEDPRAAMAKQAELTRSALAKLSESLGRPAEVRLSGVPLGWALVAGLAVGLLLGLFAAVLWAKAGCSLPIMRSRAVVLPSVGLHLKNDDQDSSPSSASFANELYEPSALSPASQTSAAAESKAL